MTTISFTCGGSSHLEKVDYDDSTDTMSVTFRDGRTYDYMNVPASTVRQFQAAGSFGEFFNRQIKSRFAYAEQ
jgi:hypothetical protein